MIQITSDKQEAALLTSTLTDIIIEYSQRYFPTTSHTRHIRPPEGAAFPWVMISYEGLRLPEQGWKLHIAASEESMELVLKQVLPVLLTQTVSFKVIESQASLGKLNGGLAGLSQIGKFITIYPCNDEEAVHLATTLDEVTRGLGAPTIPSDRPLHPGSLVHYRYGGFQPQLAQTIWGEHQMMLQNPDGELVADQRTTVYTPPAWAVDPFLAAGIAARVITPHLFIAGRYLLLTTLYQSAQSQVQLAVDLVAEQRCIVKHPGLSFVRGVEKENDPICKRLREEAQILRTLAPHTGVPAFYDLVEEHGEVFLVMEDVEGETLEASINRLKERGLKMSHDQIISWGKELAALLKSVHNAGFIHRDLKSSNVIIMPDKHLRLLDFGIAQPIDSRDRWPGSGTFGYMSPQQQQKEPASIYDDIHALGALLYFMATGAEPSIAPREKPLTARPLALLNANLPASLIWLIEKCLEADPAARFASVSELEEAFETIQSDKGKIALVISQGDTQEPCWQELSEHYRQLAYRTGLSLSQAAQSDPKGNGLRWSSTYYIGKGMQARDLNTGNSGSLLALAELVDEFDDSQQRQVLAEGARWLVSAHRLPGKPLAGLYVGESGVGTALLRAGQVLNDCMLISAAVERSRWIATLPFLSPDLFNGTAGRVRFHLWLWDATADADQLSLAMKAGESLITNAVEVNSQELCWRIPEGYGGMSGLAYLGYAHGAAGIADVLLDLYEATQQERFLMAALRAGRWLERQAVPVLADERGLDWPTTEGTEPHGAYWCHGATGIGSFFLHLAHLQALPKAQLLAERAARTVAYGNRACNPVQCHGLSGNIEFLLDMAQHTKNQQYIRWAFELATLLEAFALEKDGMLMWSSESPIIITPDYQVGYAGIAMTLLRLGNLQRPRQLGRNGLSYRPSHRNIS